MQNLQGVSGERSEEVPNCRATQVRQAPRPSHQAPCIQTPLLSAHEHSALPHSPDADVEVADGEQGQVRTAQLVRARLSMHV